MNLNINNKIVETTTTTFQPLYRNECDVITLLNMVVECQVLQNPSSPNSCDGSLQINVSGGTPPYFISWGDSSTVSFTRNNLCVGSYTATVSDYYNDFNLTTTCSLTADTTPCNCYALVTRSTTGTVFNYTDCFGVEQSITVTFSEGFLEPVYVCSRTVPTTTDIKGSVTFGGECQGKNVENCTLPTDCFCYELTHIPLITTNDFNVDEILVQADFPTSFVYWGCNGSRVTVSHTNGTYYICSRTVPAASSTLFTITKLSICSEGLCTGTTTTSTTTTTTFPITMLGEETFSVTLQNLNVQTVISQPICGCDGSITLLVSNGYVPYFYSINNGTSYQLSPIFTSLCSGLYTISVLDMSGNSNTLQVTLNEPNLPVPYVISLTKNSKVISNNGVTKTEVISVGVSVTPELPIGAYITFDLFHTNSLSTSPDFSVASVLTNTQLLKNSVPIILDFSGISTGSTVNTYPGCQDQFIYSTTLTETWNNLQINSSDTYEISTTTSVTQNSSPNCYYEDVIDSYFVSNLKIFNCSCCTVINN